MKLSMTFIALLVLSITLSHGFILRAVDGREDLGPDDFRAMDPRKHEIQTRRCPERPCPRGQYCDTEAQTCMKY
nr:conopeptide [Conus arenatus]